MPDTPAQRNAKNKWNRNNLATVSCRVPKDKAAAFKEACAKLGTVPNQVLKQTIEETIKKAEDQA